MELYLLTSKMISCNFTSIDNTIFTKREDAINYLNKLIKRAEDSKNTIVYKYDKHGKRNDGAMYRVSDNTVTTIYYLTEYALYENGAYIPVDEIESMARDIEADWMIEESKNGSDYSC